MLPIVGLHVSSSCGVGCPSHSTLAASATLIWYTHVLNAFIISFCVADRRTPNTCDRACQGLSETTSTSISAGVPAYKRSEYLIWISLYTLCCVGKQQHSSNDQKAGLTRIVQHAARSTELKHAGSDNYCVRMPVLSLAAGRTMDY